MTTDEKRQAIIEQLARDPDFLVRLGADPEGTARETGLGFTLTREELEALLGEQTDQTIVEVLPARKSKFSIANGWTG